MTEPTIRERIDAGDPGDPICEAQCPCCGASLDITCGEDEGQIAVVGIPSELVQTLKVERDALAQTVQELREAQEAQVRESFRAGFMATIDPEKGWCFDGPAAADREPEAWQAYLDALTPDARQQEDEK